MFTDDVLLFLLGTNDQFSPAIAVLQKFSNHSHCKINLPKCQAFRCMDKSFINKALKWQMETFKYLDVSILIKKCDDNKKTLLELNLVPLLNKTKNILNLWYFYSRNTGHF